MIFRSGRGVWRERYAGRSSRSLRAAIADGQVRRRLRDGALRLRARLPTWPEAGLAVERALISAIAGR